MNRTFLYLYCAGICVFCGCQTRNTKQPETLMDENVKTVIEYRQAVNGYRVEAEVIDFHFDGLMALSSALLHFRKDDGRGFSVFVEYYGDKSITHEILMNQKGMRYLIDYLPADKQYLATNTPFYFSDMDFDGREELVIVEWMCGRQFANMYDVYEVEDYYADKMTSPPFDHIEEYTTTFIPEKKQIVNYFANIWESERYIYERADHLVNGYFYLSAPGFVLKAREKSEN